MSAENPSLPPRAKLDEERAKQIRLLRAIDRVQRRMDGAIHRRATSVRIPVDDVIAIFEALRAGTALAKEQRRRDTMSVGRRLVEWLRGN
jgi:hypothetical protein